MKITGETKQGVCGVPASKYPTGLSVSDKEG